MWWRMFISTTILGLIGFLLVDNTVYKSYVGNLVGVPLLMAIIGLVFVGPLWEVIHTIRKGNPK